MKRAAQLLVCALLAACSDVHGLGPDGSVTGDAGPRPLGPPPPPASELDLLFVLENAGTIGAELAVFGNEIPRLLQLLLTGDANGDGELDFQPFESVRIAVVTTDMGTGGFTVPTCAESMLGEDGVLRTAGGTDISGCRETYPAFLGFDPMSSRDEAAFDAQCLASVGTRGCGFEQQLEAMLKALSPSAPTSGTADGYAPPRFFAETAGHGDGANAGFVRDDSLLAVVLLSEEEDCSVRDPELFDPTSRRFTTDLGLRCTIDTEDALHPIDRYVDGLLQLRRDPRRVVFFPIVGIPPDLEPAAGEEPDYVTLVSDDLDLRDERMVTRVDPTYPTRLLPSCSSELGFAYPPARMVQVARDVAQRGGRSGVASICNESLEGAIRSFVSVLRPEETRP